MESYYVHSNYYYGILLGKLLPYFFLAMTSMIICVAIAILWFEIPFRGSFLFVVYYLIFVSNSCFGTWAFDFNFVKNQFVAAQAALIVGFYQHFIIRIYFQINSMPIWLQYLTHIIPARYFVEILQCIF